MLRHILFSILTVISSYFCISLGFMAPLAPYPLLVFFKSQSFKLSVFMSIIFFSLYFLNRDLIVFSGLVFVFLISLYLGILTKRKQSIARLVSEFSICSWTFIMLLGAITLVQQNLSLENVIGNLSNQLSELSQWMISKDPSKSSQFLIIKSNAPILAKNFVHAFPSYLMIGLVFTSWLNFILLLRHRLVRKHLEFTKFTNFNDFRAPFWLIPCLIIVMSYYALNFGKDIPTMIVADNLLKIFLIPFFFHGLSVILFFLKKLKFGSFSRSMIVCLFFIPVVPMLISVLIGILDLFQDFRKKIGKGKIHASNTER